MIGYEFENILRDNIGYDLETKEAYFLDLDYIKNCAKDFLESDEEQNVENVEIEEVSIATISKNEIMIQIEFLADIDDIKMSMVLQRYLEI